MATGVTYAGVTVLAPMVRCGTLPLRLVALKHGADLVYSEEIIDHKFLKCTRSVNTVCNTIDYVHGPSGAMVLRTNAEERGKLILQLGTADPDRALRAARIAQQDIVGVDINCGCPKKFSLQGGMGAALLGTPDLLCEIVSTLKAGLSVPVTCKIRLLDTEAATIALMKRLEAAGAAAIAVHCREAHEGKHDPGHWEKLKPLVAAVSVPVIANGDIYSHADIAAVKALTGCSSIMLARGALKNPSLFRPAEDGVLPLREVVQDFLRQAARVGNLHANTKFTVWSFAMWNNLTKDEVFGVKVSAAKSPFELAEAFGVGDEVAAIYESLGVDARAKSGRVVGADGKKRLVKVKQVVPGAPPREAAGASQKRGAKGEASLEGGDRPAKRVAVAPPHADAPTTGVEVVPTRMYSEDVYTASP